MITYEVGQPMICFQLFLSIASASPVSIVAKSPVPSSLKLHLTSQMTELKASQFTIEQELRQKMKNVSREFDSKIELLQKKIREQSREIALLNRAKKKGDKGAVLSATDGGSSGTDSPSVG